MSKPIRKSSKNKVVMGALALIFVVSALFFAMFAVRTKTNIAPQAAIMSGSSHLTLVSNKKTVPESKQFEVEVYLDNSEDMAHVVTGVDAIIAYDPAMVEVVKIVNGSVFETLTSQKIDKTAGTIEISGSYSSIKDDVGNPKGYSGNGGPIATIIFNSKKLGQAKIAFVYRGGQDTSDSNIVAFKKDSLVSGQMPQERFLQKPAELLVEIVTEQTACKEECPGSDGVLRSCTPPEADGASNDSICNLKFVGRVESCGDVNYCCSRSSSSSSMPQWSTDMSLCQNSSPTPTPSPVPLSNRCEPCGGSISRLASNSGCAEGLICALPKPQCKMLNGEEVCWTSSGISGLCVNPKETIDVCKYSTPTPTPKPSISPVPVVTPTPSPRPEARIQLKLSFPELAQAAQSFLKGTLYGVDAGNVQGVMVATTLGDLNEEIDAQRNLIKDSDYYREMPNPGRDPIDYQRPANSGMVKISDFTVDLKGVVTVTVPQALEGKRMYLFVRTQSHLRKASGTIVTLPKVLDCMWQGTRRCEIAMIMPTVEFKNLTSGDIYIANGQLEQDNVVNTFDAMDLIRSLGESSVMTTVSTRCLSELCPDPKPVLTLHKADLNADSIVNIRDLKILMDNFGEKGDEPVFSSTYYRR